MCNLYAYSEGSIVAIPTLASTVDLSLVDQSKIVEAISSQLKADNNKITVDGQALDVEGGVNVLDTSNPTALSGEYILSTKVQ